MARFLAIDWDHHQLHVIAATVVRGRVTVQHALCWPEPQSPNPATAADLGKQLRERLRSAGVAPAPVLACVGRDRVIPKDVRHPDAGAADEPTLVRLQVVKELTDPPDEVIIDYTSLGPGASRSEKRSLAVVVRCELLEAYQTLCAAAGLKLAALTPRMFGLAATLAHLRATPLLVPPADPEAAVAVIAQGERWAEFLVVHRDRVVLSRALSVGPNTAGEIRRNLAVYAGQAGKDPIRAVYVAGTEHLDLQQKLQGMLSVPVALIDPFAPLDQSRLPATGRGGFAGALGLVYHQSAGLDLPINFVRPRQPVVRRDPNRRLYVLVACLVGLIVLGGLGFLAFTNYALDVQIAKLAADKKRLDDSLKALDDDDKRFKAVDEWTKSEVVWLDELYDLTDRLGDGKGVRLIQLTGDPLPRTAKSDLVARLNVRGITTDDARPVDELLAAMVRDGHYRVEPKTLTDNRGPDRQSFSRQFVTKVDVKARTSDKYLRKMPDPPPKEAERRARPAAPAAPNPSDAIGGGQP